MAVGGQGCPVLPEVPENDLPFKVVPDDKWAEEVRGAVDVCRIIDRHLDYEGRGRLLTHITDFRPKHLCPEQRVQMVSDLSAVVQQ